MVKYKKRKRKKRMKSGTKNLRMASVLEIIMGAASLFLTHYLVGHGDAAVVGISAPTALGLLVAAYGLAVFQILSGILGLMMADKKSLLSVVFGGVLFIPQFFHFFNMRGSIGMILVNIIVLVIPYLYLSSAYKNFKENQNII